MNALATMILILGCCIAGMTAVALTLRSIRRMRRARGWVDENWQRFLADKEIFPLKQHVADQVCHPDGRWFTNQMSTQGTEDLYARTTLVLTTGVSCYCAENMGPYGMVPPFLLDTYAPGYRAALWFMNPNDAFHFKMRYEGPVPK